MKSYNVVLANMDFETVRKGPCDAEVRGYQVGGMMKLSVRMEVLVMCLDFQRSDEIVRSNVYSVAYSLKDFSQAILEEPSKRY